MQEPVLDSRFDRAHFAAFGHHERLLKLRIGRRCCGETRRGIPAACSNHERVTLQRYREISEFAPGHRDLENKFGLVSHPLPR